MKKNDILTLKIDDFSHDGKGVAHHENITIFVEKGIKGEIADIKIVKVMPKKNMAYGVISELKKKSPQRIKPKCEYKNCGGCQLHHVSYEMETEFKKSVVNAALQRIAKTDVRVEKIIQAPEIYHYRSKVSVPVGKVKNQAVTGFYAAKSHNIIPMDNCIVQPATNDKILEIIRNWIDKYKISVYDESKKQGKIRHVVIRNGDNETMVVLVSRSKRINDIKKLIDSLRSFSKKITSIILNVNKSFHNKILGEQNITLYGKDTIISSISGIKFSLGPDTFFQINKKQTEVLYKEALEMAEVGKDDIIADAYCGVGTLTLFSALRAKKVIGFEINENSVKNAFFNAKTNKISNVEFIAGDVNEKLLSWANEGNKCDVLILDPPRKGATEKFWSAVEKVSPERIVYISCYPSTLARDLGGLKNRGYKPEKIIAVDMFPRTHHIETVTLLKKF